MKKLLLLFFVLIFIGDQAKAQYHPMLGNYTYWCLHWNFIPVRGERIMEYNRFDATGNTVIAGKNYLEVYTDETVYFGAVREDSAAQKVYFRHSSDTSEHLLYDFSMNMGDTIQLDFINNTYGNLNDGNYIVDSVNMVNIKGGLRKYIRLHNPANINTGPNGKPIKIEWIESVGEIHNPFYTYMYDEFGFGTGTMSCGSEGESEVMSQKTDGVRNYINMCVAANPGGTIDNDTCGINYWGSVNELETLNSRVNIYPNPSNGQNITVSFSGLQNDAGEIQLSITDLNGRNVYATTTQITGNTITHGGLNLDKGMYLLTLRSKGHLVG